MLENKNFQSKMNILSLILFENCHFWAKFLIWAISDEFLLTFDDYSAQNEIR